MEPFKRALHHHGGRERGKSRREVKEKQGEDKVIEQTGKVGQERKRAKRKVTIDTISGSIEKEEILYMYVYMHGLDMI